MSQRAQRLSCGHARDSAFEDLGAVHRQGCAEREYGARDLRQRRVGAAVLRAACHLPVHVTVAAAVALDQRAEDRAPFLARVRIRHADAGEAAREALGVGGEAERSPAVYRHELVDGVRVQEAAIERGDTRLGERQVCAVQVAQGQGLGHAL